MNHSFEVEHARLYGITEAVLITHLQFWITKNVANGTHLHEGRTWTYNSAKALSLLYPYLSDRQIRRAIDSLEKQLVVLKGNFNRSITDRTLWLSFVDEAWFIDVEKPAPKTANAPKERQKPAPKTANGSPKTANAPFAENGESLDTADINTVVNTDVEKARAPKPAQAQAVLPPISPVLLADFLAVRKAKKSGPLTETVLSGIQREADKAGITLEAAVTFCCESAWQSFRADWYANQQSGNQVATRPRTGKPTAAQAREDRSQEALDRYFGPKSMGGSHVIDIDATEI